MNADFVHLHVHTEYSLLDGAGRIESLTAKAKELGMKALAITDHGSMYGVTHFYKQAQKEGIKPIIGCEVYIAPASRFDKKSVEGESYYHLVLLAADNLGYRNLIELVSRGYTEGFYYKPRIDKEILRKYSQGIICLSACVGGEVPALFLKGRPEQAKAAAREYVDIFGQENFYIEIQDHGLPEQKQANRFLINLAGELGVGLVATNDAHYLAREDFEAHDVLLCIQTSKTVNDSSRMKFQGSEFYLKNRAEMESLFSYCPEALHNTLRIAERCNVTFDFGKTYLPDFPVPSNLTDDQYLYNLCLEALPKRYPEISSRPEPAENSRQILDRLNYETQVIKKMGYSSYFLIVWDFVRYANQEGISVGPGRGSGVGSIVSYLLGITNIDPLKYGLLFERLLNPERVSMPDIDIDFCYEKRGKIIEYVTKRYGSDRVAQIITFGTMAARAAIRDVGRVLSLPYGEVDRIAKLIPAELGITINKALKTGHELKNIYENDETIHKLLDLAMTLEGLPRHASTHAAGLVISKEPLTHYVPLQVSSEGFLTTQFDKDKIEEIGLLKMDLLGLRTLTVISDAIQFIKHNQGQTVNLDDIPLDDTLTCIMLAAGDTSGVFQMESSGMTNLVKELKPESFEDLIPLVALYRPGPLGSGMVTDFINGRHGKKPTNYMHPLLEPILKDTFGVILYQEQVMRIASSLAGFSLGQADLLRRAMGKKKPEVLAAQRDNFIKGCAEKSGIDGNVSAAIFDLMAHFADYGFNKSHSVAYALVAYQTAYLKAHYPQEFFAALLTSVIGTNEKTGHYIEECRRRGILVLPPDINESQAGFVVRDQAIRFGLAGVKNVGEGAIQSIIDARRQKGEFSSLMDFCCRIDMRVVNKRVIESLIRSGCFDSLKSGRAELLGILEEVTDAAVRKQKDAASGQIGLFDDEPEESLAEPGLKKIPEFPKSQLLAMEKEMIGFYITGHPLDEYREKIKNLPDIGTILGGDFSDGQKVKAAGLITSSKRITTKNGDMMCFVTIEDFSGQAIEVVIFPKVFERTNSLLVPDMPIVVSGRLNFHEEESGKILADNILPLDKISISSEVRINILKFQEDNAFLFRLKEALHEYPGQTVVYLHLVESRRVIKTEPEYWIDPSPEALKAIEAVLGEGSVKVT